MEPLRPASGRTARLAMVAGGLLVLLAVVAFASRSGFGHSSNAAPSPQFVSYAFTAFLILFVLAIPFVVYTFLLQMREGKIARKSLKRRLLANLLTIVVFSLIAFVILYIKAHHWHIFHANLSHLKNARNALKKSPHAKTGNYQPAFEWSLFWVMVAAGAIVASALYIQHRRRKRLPGVPLGLGPTIAEDLAQTIGGAIEDLEAESDPRRAVIAAYARMEGVLARHGLRRRPSETPVEYMRRVLTDLTSRGDAVERLTTLFEQAKFSTHEIDLGMKADAIGALRQIRDDLQQEPR